MGSFSFTAEIKEDRTLQLPAGSPTGRVTVAITPADESTPTGRRLLAKLLDLQASIPSADGPSQEQIDSALEQERASWR
ncbi:hypothetical protein [Synechococcus sp. BA-132 BA5]|uniref:hypothetical protein n=1 Tax=Synechococcus sp. BA-132 BA5 TaxID=3110252 RepID=UPI002B215B60|nr:hypothetical protein [Synechococcus sp. BA-132 BA5]MEA5416622.1 hypothetical protein [Synechococcus sp. BA-132 BA5]